MPIAESNVRWVSVPKIGLLEQLYVPAIFQGLQTTVRHAVKAMLGDGAITQQYPEVEPKLPPNYRGVHRLNRDEQGRVKCVACYMCSTACPAHCIDIVAAPSPWPDREKYPETFVIDELRCIYCGMCEQACPVDAIELTTVYDITGMTREEMMFDKEKLLSVFDETVRAGTDPVRTRPGKLSVAAELPEETGLASSSTAQS
ncbi:MAG: NuoI/complex I 23 kDa subunit family protein [Gemmataceae bacterium]